MAISKASGPLAGRNGPDAPYSTIFVSPGVMIVTWDIAVTAPCMFYLVSPTDAGGAPKKWYACPTVVVHLHLPSASASRDDYSVEVGMQVRRRIAGGR